jgi:hypothetical protein
MSKITPRHVFHQISVKIKICNRSIVRQVRVREGRKKFTKSFYTYGPPFSLLPTAIWRPMQDSSTKVSRTQCAFN